jgi:tetratricopeptide (TPR) repeat protein
MTGPGVGPAGEAGPPTNAPATLSLYELAAHELKAAARILDGGCGGGAGTELLSRAFAEVVAIDCNAHAVESATLRAPRAKVLRADLSAPGDVGAIDAAVLIDTLGSVKTPETVLLSMRAILPLGRPLFIAEAVAHRGQFLRAPARRAFTRSGLTHLLAASGFEIEKWLAIEGSFLACVAVPFSEPAFELLCRARDELDHGRMDGARPLFEQAEKESVRSSIRLEAAVGQAYVSLLQRNADGAVAACVRARAIADGDLRPAALLARVALAVGERDEAKRLARLAEQLDPADVEAAFVSAVVAAAGDDGSAKAAWLSASNLSPDSLEIATHLAACALKEEDSDLAIFALERVRNYGDDHGAPLHIALASALLAAGKRADALLEARLAQKLAPGDKAILELVANLQVQGG